MKAYTYHGQTTFPHPTGLRIMMMPVIFGDTSTVPEQYRDMVSKLTPYLPADTFGRVGYLTIDEAFVRAGEHHRRPGLHVDGVYRGSAGGWGGGGGWGCRGMLVMANAVGCRVYNDVVRLEDTGNDGEVNTPPTAPGHDLVANGVYGFGPLTVHESLPLAEDCMRQFLRLSFPSDAPWFEGYTESPFGVLPAGPVLSRRQQMDYRR